MLASLIKKEVEMEMKIQNKIGELNELVNERDNYLRNISIDHLMEGDDSIYNKFESKIQKLNKKIERFYDKLALIKIKRLKAQF